MRDYRVRWVSFPISLQNKSGFHCHCLKEKDNLGTLRDFSKGKLIEFWYSRTVCVCESQELIFLTLSTCDHHFNRIDSVVASLASLVPTCPRRWGCRGLGVWWSRHCWSDLRTCSWFLTLLCPSLRLLPISGSRLPSGTHSQAVGFC